MIDKIITLLYLIGILCVGLYNRSKISSFKNYTNFNDNKYRNNIVFLTASIFASSIGGGTTFGLSEKAFSGDIAFTYGLLFTIPVDLLVARYLLPKLVTKHYGAKSVGDIIARYYGTVGRVIAGVSAIMVSIGFIAAQIRVSAIIFQYIVEVNHIQAIILSYGIVIIYTTIGGLSSIMFTNLVQFFAMIVAIPIITIIGIDKIGLPNLMDVFPAEKVSLMDSEVLSHTIAATLAFAVMGMYPNFIQRSLISEYSTNTKKAIYLKSAIYFVFLVCVTANGLIAFQLFPDDSPSNGIIRLIDEIIPIGIKGLVIVGLLSAVMSTADSDLNVTSISIVKDLLEPVVKIKSQTKLLLLMRVANILMGVTAIVMALQFNSVVDLVMFVVGFWSPLILIPLIFALFDVVVSKKAMLISSFLGSLSFLIWDCYLVPEFHFTLKGVFVGTMISLAIFLLGLYFQPKRIIKDEKQG